MIATKDSTGETMRRALAHTSNAIDAAISLDVDRSDEDRAFFQAEKAIVDAAFDKVDAADRAATLHELRESQRYQARVEVGDVVLDRGTRRGKKRMALEVGTKAADAVFGEDISEIVDAERHVEPTLVLKCVDRLGQAGDFAGKSALITDLTGRLQQQTKNFQDRTAADITGAGLESALDNAIAEASDGLYKLEKRLLERFPRERVYVRAFFFDVGRKKAKKKEG
jgi:hypothetical protein